MSTTIEEMIRYLDYGYWEGATNLEFETKGIYLTKEDVNKYALWEEDTYYIKKVGTINKGMLITLGLKDDWVEHESRILDIEEKNYLESALSPFKNRVKSISKVNEDDGFIVLNGALPSDTSVYRIKVTFNDSEERFYFPSFTSKAMYKGMELYKVYTLRDLGLYEPSYKYVIK